MNESMKTVNLDPTFCTLCVIHALRFSCILMWASARLRNSRISMSWAQVKKPCAYIPLIFFLVRCYIDISSVKQLCGEGPGSGCLLCISILGSTQQKSPLIQASKKPQNYSVRTSATWHKGELKVQIAAEYSWRCTEHPIARLCFKLFHVLDLTIKLLFSRM